MKTAEEILKKKFESNFLDIEYIDLIVDAMEEYAEQQVKNCNTPAVVWQSGQAGFCMHNLDMKGKCFKCEEQYIRKEG